MNEQLNILDLPPHVHTETSYRAAEEIKKHVPRLRSLVLGFIQAKGPCTDEQVSEGLGLAQNTCRPRRIELAKSGLIKECEEKAKTKSGRWATLWKVACVALIILAGCMSINEPSAIDLDGSAETWLIIGQSNSVTWTDDFGLIRHPEEIGLMVLNQPEFPVSMNLQPKSFQEFGSYSELAGFFAKELNEETGEPVNVIAAGIGGTSINCWLTGDCYQDNIKPLLATRIDGIVWWQGESDHGMDAEEYKEKFESFIYQLRHDFRNSNMPFVYVRLQEWDDPLSDEAEGVRLAQDESQRIDCVSMVSATDLSDGDLHPKIKDKIATRILDGIKGLNDKCKPKTLAVPGF